MTAPAGLFDDLIPAKGAAQPTAAPANPFADLIPQSGGPFGAPTSAVQANVQNVGHGVLSLPATTLGTPGAVGAMIAQDTPLIGGAKPALEQIGKWLQPLQGALQRGADQTAPLTTDAQMGLADHPIIAKLARFLEDTGGNSLAGSAVGGLASAARTATAPFLSPIARVAKAIDESGGVPQMRDNLASFVSAGHGGNASLAALADPLGDLARQSAAKSPRAAAALADLAQASQPYDPAARIAALGTKAARAAAPFTAADAARAATYIGGAAGAAALHHPGVGGGALMAGALAHALEGHVAGQTGDLLTTQGATAVSKLLDAIEAYHAQPGLSARAIGGATGAGAGLMNYVAHSSAGEPGQSDSAPQGNVAAPSTAPGDTLARSLPPPLPRARLGEGGQFQMGINGNRRGPSYRDDPERGGAP